MMSEYPRIEASIRELFTHYPSLTHESTTYDGKWFGIVFLRTEQVEAGTIMPKTALLLTIREVKEGKLEQLLNILGTIDD